MKWWNLETCNKKMSELQNGQYNIVLRNPNPTKEVKYPNDLFGHSRKYQTLISQVDIIDAIKIYLPEFFSRSRRISGITSQTRQ